MEQSMDRIKVKYLKKDYPADPSSGHEFVRFTAAPRSGLFTRYKRYIQMQSYNITIYTYETSDRLLTNRGNKS